MRLLVIETEGNERTTRTQNMIDLLSARGWTIKYETADGIRGMEYDAVWVDECLAYRSMPETKVQKKMVMVISGRRCGKTQRFLDELTQQYLRPINDATGRGRRRGQRLGLHSWDRR